MKQIKKMVALVVAVMMMAAMSLTAFATTQQYYFYTDEEGTTPSNMGHGCIEEYDVNSDGTVTLYLASETYTRNNVTYKGYISELTANGKTETDLRAGDEFTFTPAGQVTPVQFVISMYDVTNPGTVIKHPVMSGYLKLNAVQ